MEMVEKISELKKICQVWEPRTYSEKFYRNISIYITKLLLYTPITPNQTTLLFAIAATVAGIFFIFGNYILSIFGALMVQLYYVLDSCDGEIARYMKKTSIFGDYFERICHKILDPFIFLCISIGVYRNSQNVIHFIFGFTAGISLLLIRLADSELSASIDYFSNKQESARTNVDVPNESENSKLLTFLKETYTKTIARFDLMGLIGVIIIIGAFLNVMRFALYTSAVLLALVVFGCICNNAILVRGK